MTTMGTLVTMTTRRWRINNKKLKLTSSLVSPRTQQSRHLKVFLLKRRNVPRHRSLLRRRLLVIQQATHRHLPVVPREELTGVITVKRMTSSGWFFLEQSDDSDYVASDVDMADDEDESMSDKSSALKHRPLLG